MTNLAPTASLQENKSRHAIIQDISFTSQRVKLDLSPRHKYVLVSFLAAFGCKNDLSVCCALLLAVVFLIIRDVCKRAISVDVMIRSAQQLADYRVLAAQREAARGFAACMACGFKNFVRVMHCALCGLSSLDPELSVTVRPIPDSLIDEEIPLPLAHKRREWTRQLDDQDRLVWRRRLGEKSDHLPGYVLRFELPVEAEPESESAVLSRKERSLSTGYDPSAGVQFELLEPHDVDPTQFPLPPPHADMVDMMEDIKQTAVVLAAQDFPAKYAHFVASTTMLLQDGDGSVESCLTVHRDYILEQSIQHIKCIHEANIRLVPFNVSFVGEGDVSSDDKGVGGLHREWLTLLNEKLVDPEVGLFSCTKCSDQSFFINPQSESALGVDHLQYFYATGRLVGRALLEGAVLNFHLCAPLLKMMLGIPIAFGDLEYLDAEMYKNLTWLLDNDDAGTLELDFTVSQRHGNHVQTVELIPAGRNIQVNDDNKFEFADRKFRFMMFESVAPQLVSFLKGFYEVVPQRLLLAFDEEELDYLLCGSDKIDVSDWKRHTHLALESRREVAWFWDVVENMSDMYQKQLLHFATGFSRVPLVGFQGLTSYDGQLCQFTLADAGGVDYFRSHACYNMLELPNFSMKDELSTALYAALYNEYGVYDVKSATPPL